MKVKKIIGANNHEAMKKVRLELGPEAIILHQRKVKPKGLLGYFKKPFIEIVAAVEDINERSTQQINKSFQRNTTDSTGSGPINSKATEEILKKIMEKRVQAEPKDKLQEKIQEKQQEKQQEEQHERYQEKPSNSLTKEINEIKNMLSTVVRNVKVKDLPNVVREYQNKHLEIIYHLLKEQEIEEEIITYIIKELMKNADSHTSKEILEQNLKEIIDKCVINKEELNSKVIFFVGPTGVGKTTTIAKLAAHYSLSEGKKVGFISADTYRIAAVEQLKIYSDILNIPVEVIYNPEEIHQALAKLNHKDIIMVDTAGRSHRNQKQVKELQSLLEQLDKKEIYLVVSCTSKNNDIREIIETYDFIDNFKIILTKIDEATTYGTIINTALQTQKPITYMTTGQSVPDDIEAISVDRILSLLIKEA